MIQLPRVLATLVLLPAVLPAQEAPPDPLAALRAEAAALRPQVESGVARAFLDATSALPAIEARTVYTNADRSEWFTKAQADALPEVESTALTERVVDASFYWNTRYGSPVAYARALDLAAQHGLGPGASIADFGCGGLGAPRLLASLGCRVAGIDVDPLLPALYSGAGDTGEIAAAKDGAAGRLALVTGQWPADAATVAAMKAALPEGVDLFLSKNTLKNGYLHPSQPVDPRRLVHLGVADEEFVRAVAESLNPGGVFLIYNLCPAPAKEGEPYIPWADGRCPFPRAMLEGAGLQVVAFDQVDDAAARAMGDALGWDDGEHGMDLPNDLFAWYTLAVKPAR